MKTRVFIDGKEGTTGLQIYERFQNRNDVEIMLIDEEKRKDVNERAKMINSSDTCHAVSGYSGGGKKMIAAMESENKTKEMYSPRQYALGQKHKHIPEMQAVCGHYKNARKGRRGCN